MILRINLPPEFLGEIRRVTTDTLEIIEIFGRDLLEEFAEMSHGDLGHTVVDAARIDMGKEILHELAALGLASLMKRCAKVCADVLHPSIV